MNKYEKWYENITSRGKTDRNINYTEKHHIIPKCLGGTDDIANLTNLTAREHFIVHWLLTKIHFGQERYLLLNALQGMRRENQNQQRYYTKITARVYANLKEEWSKLSSDRVKGENNPMYGDKFYRSEEGKTRQRIAVIGDKNGSKKDTARKKISDSKKGKSRAPFSEEWKAKLSAAKKGENNNRYGAQVSEETRKKISEKAKGRKQSPEVIAKKADAIRGLKREKKLCPHCQQMIAVNTYARWHGEKCKSVKYLITKDNQ
jgi:ribosomal protein S27AE